MELLRRAEIERVRGRLGLLTRQQEEAIEALTKGIVNKVLHTPIAALKTAAKAQHSESMIEMVAQLFNLRRDKKKDAGTEHERCCASARAAPSSRSGRPTMWRRC